MDSQSLGDVHWVTGSTEYINAVGAADSSYSNSQRRWANYHEALVQIDPRMFERAQTQIRMSKPSNQEVDLAWERYVEKALHDQKHGIPNEH